MMRSYLIVIAMIIGVLFFLSGCIGPTLIGEDTAMVTVRLVRDPAAGISPQDFAAITSVSVTLDGENGTYTESANIVPALQSAVSLFTDVPPGTFSGFTVDVTGMSAPKVESLNFTVSAASQLTIEVSMDWNVPTVLSKKVVSSSGGPTAGIGFVSTNNHEALEISNTMRMVGVGEVADMSFVQVEYPDGITYFAGSKPSYPVYITFTSSSNGFVIDRYYFDHFAEESNINGDYLFSVEYGAGQTVTGSTNVSVDFIGMNSFANFTDDGGGPFIFDGDSSVDADSAQQFEVNLMDIPATGVQTMLFYVYDNYWNKDHNIVSSTVVSGPALPDVLMLLHDPNPELDTLEWNVDYGAVVLLFDTDINVEFLDFVGNSYGSKDMDTVVNLILALDGLYSEFEIDFIAGASIHFRTY